ncbi:tyrosine-type recombinase/integrase [Listeria fleischmannii]
MFCDRFGYPILQDRFRDALRRMCKNTGVPYHSKHPAHAFRHTHVKRLDEAGISETAIQQRIGHTKGSKITRIYTHSDEIMRKDTINIYAEYKRVKNI